MTVGVITTSGITKLMTSQITGASFQPNVVQISSDILPCTGDEISMPDIVYDVSSSMITQIPINNGTLRTIIALDATVGNFTIGTVGLYTSDGTLIALAAFPGAGTKLANNLPAQIGNIRTLYVDINYVGIANNFVAPVPDDAVYVDDENYTVINGTRYIDVIAITAPRIITIPFAANYSMDQPIKIFDSSGNCSTSNTITIATSGGQTINGESTAQINVAYGFLILQSDGIGSYTITGSSLNLIELEDTISNSLTPIVAAEIVNFISNLPTTPPSGGGFWLDGGILTLAPGGGGTTGATQIDTEIIQYLISLPTTPPENGGLWLNGGIVTLAGGDSNIPNSLTNPVSVSSSTTITTPGYYLITTPNVTITLANGPMPYPSQIIIKDWTSTSNPRITIAGLVDPTATLIYEQGGSFTYSWSTEEGRWINNA